MKFNGTAVNVPEEEMMLRIASSIEAKRQKLQTYREKRVISDAEPLVIAINRSDLEHIEPLSPGPLILKVLFGIGYQTVSIPIGDTKCAPMKLA